ncbi:MAG: crotonase/enoyl-CoA hydratase family protein [Janthinobacterium lividum]
MHSISEANVCQGQAFSIGIDGPVATITLERAFKRNALDDQTVDGLGKFFETVPENIEVIILCGRGHHFSVGLDLANITPHTVTQAMQHSRAWQRAFDRIQYCRVPVIAVLKGAVFGGGLEMACACHIRIAEASTLYRLPECQLGIFVGAGGSVRISRLAGLAVLTDMLLTGRTLNASEGMHAGLAQYLVENGQGLDKARELAQKIRRNTPTANFGVIQILPRLAEQSDQAGLLTEAMMLAIAQSEPETMTRLAQAVKATRNAHCSGQRQR